jgi:glycosyltransferase involved in cell wall biosynthesis
MNILYLVPHVPNPTKARSHYHIRGLVEAGHHVVVATLARSETDQKHIEKLRAAGIPVLASTLTRKQMLVNAFSALLTRAPLQAAFMWSPALMAAIEDQLLAEPPDIIHIEHLRMTRYGLKLLDKGPVIWDAVDHLATLFRQTAQSSLSRAWRLIARIEAPRLAYYEPWLTGQFPLTLVISQADRELFQQANPYADRVQVALPGLPVSEFGEPVRRHEHTLILTGTLDYHPNVASIHYFVDQIWPLVCQACPTVKLQLVGARPVPSIQRLVTAYPGQIEVTGFVPSLIDYLRQATVALAPITYAAGMQNKVLEAFFTSTPLVATSMALRGVEVQHDKQVLVGDTAEDFARGVIRLLENPALRQSIGEAGRQYVEQHHALSRTTDRLVSFYRDVIAADQARLSPR